MHTQRRERPRLALLPKPTVTSGKCTSVDILSDGVIDWEYVNHLWVFPMLHNNNGRIYAPCIVFVDGSWAKIGPVGTLDEARQLCFRWSALHDRGVCDQTRPSCPLPIEHAGSVIDGLHCEIGHALPGDPWIFNETDSSFKLDLIQLGIDIANASEGSSLDERMAHIDEKLKEISAIFRSSDVIQPHLAKAYLSKASEAALFWATEAQAVDDAEVETPEEDGRSFADAVRKDGVTYEEAVLKLGRYLGDIYSNIRNEDGTPLADAEERKHKAYKAGVERLAYFAGVSA